jgi:diaminobutyrate-2-oxoglutarate transaminase
MGSLALTGNQYYHDLSYGSHNNVTHLPFDGYLGDFDTSLILERMLNDPSSGLPTPAAVILETVQGEGGIRVASTSWLQRIAKICKQHDVLLIVDDIQVGNGRTGTFFSFEPSGIKPDLVCLSKAIGGGFPMSLVLINPDIDIWQPGQHTGTFRGNNLAFVASRAVLEYWRDDALINHIAENAKTIVSRLQKISDKLANTPVSIRGKGMVWGIDTGDTPWASDVCKKAFENGLMIETSGANDQVIKLLPPLTISNEELCIGLDILERSIETVIANLQPVMSVSIPSITWPTVTPAQIS